MGWITNLGPIADFFARTRIRRTDLLICSDSNTIFGGFGQDHGIAKALSALFPLCKTNIFGFNILGGADTSGVATYGNGLAKINLPAATNPASNDYRVELAGEGFRGVNLEYDIFGNERPITNCSDIAPTVGPIELAYTTAQVFDGGSVSYRGQQRACGFEA